LVRSSKRFLWASTEILEYAPNDWGPISDCSPAEFGNPERLTRHPSTRQPHDAARSVAVVAVSWLAEGAGQLPFLRFIAPLGNRVRNDIVGLAVGADGC
jgi:hypothetical protein